METNVEKIVRKYPFVGIPTENNTIYKVEFTVGSNPNDEVTVMDISWDIEGILHRVTKRHYFDLSPEKTRILWMKKDHKTLKKEFDKCNRNYEITDFKHCMKQCDTGGSDGTINWSVRFLSQHDFDIINQIEDQNHKSFMDECGGGYSCEGDKLIHTKKENPEESYSLN